MKRLFSLLVVNLLVFCVAAELLALAIFYFQTGWLFYVDPYRPTRELIAETQGQRLTGDGLSPYFGPTHSAGIPFDIPEGLRSGQPRAVKTNNFGFVSPYNYPFAKTGGDQFVVGIFGGSVGVWFCQLGADRLLGRLKAHEFFRARQLVPLCLSHEGYKQPQQLLLLAYFLSIGQEFDLVINIDGFNEVALSAINDQRGSDISMPSAVHLDPLINLVNQSTLTPEKLESLASISRYKQRLNWFADRVNRSRLAVTYLAYDRSYAWTEQQYRTELARFDALPSIAAERSLVLATPRLEDRDGSVLFEDIAQHWIASSALMREMLAARSVPYFHVLQPNQYFSRRRFSGEEGKIALSSESPFKTSVEKGYPLLVKQAASAKERVRVLDATSILDNEPAAVYMDNCCHYTLKGNELLADFIARSILSAAETDLRLARAR